MTRYASRTARRLKYYENYKNVISKNAIMALTDNIFKRVDLSGPCNALFLDFCYTTEKIVRKKKFMAFEVLLCNCSNLILKTESNLCNDNFRSRTLSIRPRVPEGTVF